jgi:PKD repeat protein
MTLHFEASPSTLDPAFVTWTFGDGAPASTGSLVVDHTYAAGTFTVTLQVNEAACGTDVIRSVPLTVPFAVDLAPIP